MQESLGVIKESRAQNWANSVANCFLLEYNMYQRSRNSRELITKQKDD